MSLTIVLLPGPEETEFSTSSRRGMLTCRYEVPLACLQDLLVGLRLRRALRGLHQCANDAAACQFDLEGIVLVSLSATKRHVRRVRESGSIGGLSAQHCFGRRITPRLVRHAAERPTGLLDPGPLQLPRGRDPEEGRRLRPA